MAVINIRINHKKKEEKETDSTDSTINREEKQNSNDILHNSLRPKWHYVGCKGEAETEPHTTRQAVDRGQEGSEASASSSWGVFWSTISLTISLEWWRPTICQLALHLIHSIAVPS